MIASRAGQSLWLRGGGGGVFFGLGTAVGVAVGLAVPVDVAEAVGGIVFAGAVRRPVAGVEVTGTFVTAAGIAEIVVPRAIADADARAADSANATDIADASSSASIAADLPAPPRPAVPAL